jgi:23S rRNA (guanosine2251-2'-O)-methyltransferase
MDQLNRMSSEAYKSKEPSYFHFLLDDVRSMSNVGSIFRTADGFGVDTIFLGGITPRPPHREIEKTALGATEAVKWEYHEDAIMLTENLKKKGKKIVCIEQVENSQDLFDFEPVSQQDYVFVLGNEVFGVKQEIVDLADFVIEIPQFGSKHSFNVAISAAIVLWDFYSKITGKVLK